MLSGAENNGKAAYDSRQWNTLKRVVLCFVVEPLLNGKPRRRDARNQRELGLHFPLNVIYHHLKNLTRPAQNGASVGVVEPGTIILVCSCGREQ